MVYPPQTRQRQTQDDRQHRRISVEFWPRTDFHIHATLYRAQSPREEMSVAAIVHRCEELCLSEVGILEHLNPSPRHPLECMEALAEEFRATSSDVPLSLGVEVNIEDAHGPVGDDQWVAGHGLGAGLHFVGMDVYVVLFVGEHAAPLADGAYP